MKVGDLVKLTGCNPGHGNNEYPKDFEFQKEIGTIISDAGYRTAPYGWVTWWTVFFPTGVYDAREDRLEVINESR